MRIKEISLKNFKRFTDLTIKDIPESAKLVLLIGANGSGKSSVFDAFNLSSDAKPPSIKYYTKGNSFFQVNIIFDRGKIKIDEISNLLPLSNHNETSISLSPIGKDSVPLSPISDSDLREISGDVVTQLKMKSLFLGRSSIRILPKISKGQGGHIIGYDLDRPLTFIEPDLRFNEDVTAYSKSINEPLRERLFKGNGSGADNSEIFREYISPLNESLKYIFGKENKVGIELSGLKDATVDYPPNLIFKKGNYEMPYDLLSHGEKQIIILLLDFIVRRNYYQDSIYFIDEMDTHLETSIQKRLIKDVVEKWIPEGSQLWTASHALGFIEYAKTSSHSEILDFDNLDFDVPQVITPSPKDNPDVYEIAVGKEFLPSLFAGYDFVFVENSDKEVYSQIEMPKTIFIRANDKNDVVHKAGEIDSIYKGVVDRDFLSDDDVAQIKAHYKKIYVLEYYSVENYLYHPDNLEEYCRGKKDFDKQAYINKIVEIKNDRVLNHDLVADIDSARNKYPYFKQQRFNSEKELNKRFKDSDESKVQRAAISQMLKSNDLETFYKVFSMKAYSGSIAEKQHISKVDLSKTNWFKTKIKELLA